MWETNFRTNNLLTSHSLLLHRVNSTVTYFTRQYATHHRVGNKMEPFYDCQSDESSIRLTRHQLSQLYYYCCSRCCCWYNNAAGPCSENNNHLFGCSLSRMTTGCQASSAKKISATAVVIRLQWLIHQDVVLPRYSASQRDTNQQAYHETPRPSFSLTSITRSQIYGDFKQESSRGRDNNSTSAVILQRRTLQLNVRLTLTYCINIIHINIYTLTFC